VQVKTPVGLRHGSLSVVADGDSLSGVLGTEKGSSVLVDGTITGNEVSFTAKIKTPMGRMKAHVTGVIDGDTFTGTAKLPLGVARRRTGAEIRASRLMRVKPR
jgi:hypothetical protein